MEFLEQNGDAKANKGPGCRFRVLFSEQKRGYEGKGARAQDIGLEFFWSKTGI